MNRMRAIKTGIDVGLVSLALYALSFIPPAPAEYRRMVADIHPEPGLETLIFTDGGYEEERSTHHFFRARSSLFIFSADGKLLQRQQTAMGDSHKLLGGGTDFNRYAQQVAYEDIDPKIRKYLPVPKDPTKEEE